MKALLLPLALQVAAAPLLLSRDEAGRLSPQELQARVLAGFPHRRIVRTRMSEATYKWFTPVRTQPLGWISFTEQGQPIGGRLCRTREIMATFTRPDADSTGRKPARPDLEPQRLFHIGGLPQIAVVNGRATNRSCATVERYASVPPQLADQAIALVRTLVARGKDRSSDRSDGLRLDGCKDQTQRPYQRCDAERTLRLMDWTRLLDVGRTSFTGEPVTWRVSVVEHVDAPGALGMIWNLILTPTGDGWSLAMRREIPPPGTPPPPPPPDEGGA